MSVKSAILFLRQTSVKYLTSRQCNIKYSNWSAAEYVKKHNSNILIKNANVIKNTRRIELNWNNENISSSSQFPFIWLRDNCQCPACFHPVSMSRTVNWTNTQLNTIPINIEVSKDGLTVYIRWADSHESTFLSQWLHERRFEKDAQEKWLNIYKQRKEIWDSSSKENFPRKRHDFNLILNNNNALLQWLLELERRGIALIEGAGSNDEERVRKLANRVAFIRRTHYGEEFSVKAKLDPSNVAYTGETLQLHTDLPYYEYKPGVNMLHCLVQAKGTGGENQLVDSLRIATIMKEKFFEYYKILSNVIVDWSDYGEENNKAFHSLYRAPVICEDLEGNIIRVNYSQPQRDSHFNANIEYVEKWYEALQIFTKLMVKPENCVQYKLNEGEILTFDNLRICHGRSAYNPSNDIKMERHLVGAYLDWDEIRSRIRVLLTEDST